MHSPLTASTEASSNKKKILRLTPNQVLKQVMTNAEQATFMTPNNTLRGQAKACGLFDFDLISELEQNDLFNTDDTTSFLDNLLYDSIVESTNPASDSMSTFNYNGDLESSQFLENINPINETKKPISKFAKKINELNMRITIPNEQVESSSINLNTRSPIVITPETEKIYYQFIESIPSAQLQINENQPTFCDQLDGTEETFEKLILNMPTSLTTLTQAETIEPIQLDHDYSSKKRKFSCDLIDESCTTDSFASSLNESYNLNSSISSQPQRAKRTRGIYRAGDIIDESDLQNYLERRKKNNISSKISRANKKKSYIEMDVKCAELDISNERLKKKIVELEQINKLIKDLLVEKFTKR